MASLTMTRISGDIDTVALMGYADASNRNDFIRNHCRENYGYWSLPLHKAVAGAFKESAEMSGISTAPRRNYHITMAET